MRRRLPTGSGKSPVGGGGAAEDPEIQNPGGPPRFGGGRPCGGFVCVRGVSRGGVPRTLANAGERPERIPRPRQSREAHRESVATARQPQGICYGRLERRDQSWPSP